MKKIITTDVVDPTIEQPFTANSLDFIQDNTKEVIDQIVGTLTQGSLVGQYTILWGCVETDDGAGTHFSCTAGAIKDDEGEIYTVAAVAGAPITTTSCFDRLTSNDPTADPLTFTDGISRNVHNIRTAVYKDSSLATDFITQYASFFRFTRTLEKIINIGSWDMTAAGIRDVAHGLSASKIRSWDVIILEDGSPTTYYKIDSDNNFSGSPQGFTSLINTDVRISRLVGGFFDTTQFDDTSINRGYITIRYVI